MSTIGSKRSDELGSDEARLVYAAQAKDSRAFQTLVHLYLPAIHRYCLRMLGNDNDASDLCQEVFFKSWLNIKKFDPTKAKLSTWLHQIAHNLCIDSHRKARRQVILHNEVQVQSRVFEDSHQASMDAREEQNDSSARVQISLQKLPERQRSALLFCHYQGLSNKQAAQILDVSVDALESLLSRARRALKRDLMESAHD